MTTARNHSPSPSVTEDEIRNAVDLCPHSFGSDAHTGDIMRRVLTDFLRRRVAGGGNENLSGGATAVVTTDDGTVEWRFRPPTGVCGSASVCIEYHRPGLDHEGEWFMAGAATPVAVNRERIEAWARLLGITSVQSQNSVERSTLSVRPEDITRVEVIDHRTPALRGDSPVGRVYVANGASVELQYQDDGRTLKVFVEDRP